MDAKWLPDRYEMDETMVKKINCLNSEESWFDLFNKSMAKIINQNPHFLRDFLFEYIGFVWCRGCLFLKRKIYKTISKFDQH